MKFIYRHNKQISSIISIFFATTVWLLLVFATLVITPVFVTNPDFGTFVSICIFGGMFFIFPAAGIYYAINYTLRRKIFWSVIPKGHVPPVKHNRHEHSIIIKL